MGTPIGVPVWAAVRRRVASLRLNWRWQRASLALAPSTVALILGLLEFNTAVLYLTQRQYSQLSLPTISLGTYKNVSKNLNV